MREDRPSVVCSHTSMQANHHIFIFTLFIFFGLKQKYSMHAFLFYVCISCCLKCTVYQIGYVCNIFPNEPDEDCSLGSLAGE